MPLFAPTEENLRRAAQLLRAGELVAFPTETVYGLGANALDPDAVAKIYRAKGRPSQNPLIVHVPDKAIAIATVVAEWTETADRLAEAFWPGGLTLVLPRQSEIPDIVTGGGNTVGVRVPAHPLAQRLLEWAGVPVAAPSANRSLSISPTLAEHVEQSLGEYAPFILNGGATPGGVESTVLLLTENPPRLLRPGMISPDEIEKIIGKIVRPSFEQEEKREVTQDVPLLSPGLLSRHYAPNATLTLAKEDGEFEVGELRKRGERVGWLRMSSQGNEGGTGLRKEDASGNLIIISMPRDAVGYAARLFAALYELDAAGVTQIIVQKPPRGDHWLAIHDRLTRAATR